MDNSQQRIIRVYIAGAYTFGHQADNVRVAIDAGDSLLRAGLVPFIPHLAHFWHISHPHAYDTWLNWCLSWIPQCDALLRLPGNSPGADREVALAQSLHIPVYHDITVLIEHATSGDAWT